MSASTGLEVREYVEGDEEECLALRNDVFPPISPEDWRQDDTAAVARLGGRVVGIVPFVVRAFRLRADLVVRAAFANSVAVAADCRGQGIGSAMMREASQFLRSRADAMMVYTGDEVAGRPYHFYRGTGHADLAYPARAHLTGAQGRAIRTEVEAEKVDASQVGHLEADMLAAFEVAWSGYGGFAHHEAGYYRRALSSHIFVELPVEELLLLKALPGGRLEGYCLVGIRPQGISVLEWAWSSREGEEAVVSALWHLSQKRGVGATVWTCRSPFRPFGGEVWRWERERRYDVLVGRCIRPENLWAGVGLEGGLSLRLEVWTPEGELVLGEEGAPLLRLEMKRAQLDQLLLCRRNLEEDVRLQRVTVAAGTWEMVLAASSVLRASPWECHQLDYI
jgi:GNAT superfamily N-acetyltransferase